MIKYPLKFPRIIKYFYPDLITEIPTKNKIVYLTFDDGPTPGITDWVLELLDNFQAKASFFCIGKKIKKNPEIVKKINKKGHSLGNHTFQHNDAWKTNNKLYNESIIKTKNVLKKMDIETDLFRPPYGKFSRKVIKNLDILGYKMVLWTLISGDFSTKIQPEKVAQKIINKTKKGDIIVFHDSKKAFFNLQKMLPIIIEGLQTRGFRFEAIDI